MPLSKITEWPQKDCLLGVWRISETQETDFTVYQDPTVRAEVDGMRLMVRKLERLAVYSLLETMTGSLPRLLHLDSGAPFLEDSPCHMSLSHTRGWAAVMLCKEQRVGVDIEVISDRPLKALGRLCQEKETAAFGQDHLLEAAMVAFSLKESCYKLLDEREAANFKDVVEVSLPPFAPSGPVPVLYHALKGDQRLRGFFCFEKDYVLTSSLRGE